MSVTGPIRKQMGPLKFHAKNKKEKSDALLAQPIPDATDVEAMHDYIETLQVAQASLQTSLEKLQEKHDEWSVMVQDLPASEQKHYEDAVDEVMDLISGCMDTSNALTARLRRVDRTPHGSTNVSGISEQDHASLQPQHPKAFKAAKINLPKFSGDYMEFKQFWGIFSESIDKRTDLTNIEKFTYLLQQLESDAKKAIGGVLITEDNYPVAVALLKSRFDRADERLVTMLYSSFMRIPMSSRRIVEKQKTLDECERIFRQLESANEDVNSNKSLVCGLLSKFPTEMVKDLQRYYNAGPNDKLNAVREALRKSIADEESTAGVIGDLQAIKINGNSGGHPGQVRFQDDWKAFPDSALVARERGRRFVPGTRGAQPQFLSPPGRCYFCDGEHFNGDCTMYPSARGRQQRLLELKRCPRCMKPDHKGTQCPIAIRCVYCRTNENHTSALCFRQYPQNFDRRRDPQQFTVYQPRNFVPRDQQQNQRQQPFSAPPNSGQRNAVDNQQREFGNHSGASGGVTMLNHGQTKSVLFQTAKTTIVNPANGQWCTVRLAMDTLSSRTYIRDPIARKLGLLTGQNERLFVSVFGTSKTLEVPTTRVEFDIVLRDGNRVSIEANTTKIICQSGAALNNWSDLERKTLCQLQSSLADDPFDNDNVIDVLIGAGHVWEFIEGPRMPTAAPRVFIIPSKFGLMLSGESQNECDEQGSTLLCITESSCQFPSEIGLVTCESKLISDYPDIDEFWELERIGITDDPTENDDDKALDIFQATVERKEDRYEVSLPWIEEKRAQLPSNYSLAYSRFRSLTKRLKFNPELLQAYRDILSVQVDRGIIEEVPSNEIDSENLTHYLPHHPVFKPSSNTTKVRIVYDAAAKANRNSLCLNECLLRGPVLLPDLCQLLIRLRVNKTVVMSDIEKAFLQVGLSQADRDVVRFLWYKDDTNLSLTDNITAYRFTRVNFGVICSPFLLAATLDHHLTQEDSPFAESLRGGIYVDNVFSGFNDDDDPTTYYTSLKELFQRAGMNIQEFCSNSAEFMKGIPESDRVKNTDVNVLGMKWDSLNDDTFRLVPSKKLENCASAKSKREVLKAIASVFDPMGLFQPILLPAKCFLQKLWEQKYDWDKGLTSELMDEWKTLSECLACIFTHRIPRFVGVISPESTLAVFSDASAKSYATAVYLRNRQPDGSWSCQLIYAKSRLAPSTKSKSSSEKVTLPRLELLGAVIGTRAGRFCRAAFKNQDMKIDFFIDSQCVLRWISHKGMTKRFVENRVQEIRKVTACEFHYVNTKDNPSDYSTRGKLPGELFTNTLWWHGPSWLSRDRLTWPKSEIPPVSDSTLREIKAEFKVHFGHTLVAAEGSATASETAHFLSIDVTSYSRLRRLLRVSAICMRFLKKRVWNKLPDELRGRNPNLKHLFESISEDNQATSEEYDVVLQQWVKVVQSLHYSEIISHFRGSAVQVQHSRTQPLIQQLGLQLDSFAVLRSHGRFDNADLPLAARQPMLLPKNDYFTRLVVLDVHDHLMHSGVSHTLSQIRLKFWIPHGRALVKTVLRDCLICRRFKTARPFKLPPMPSWPKERVAQSAPFQATGLDYFGPINVKIADKTQKMWGCLFTCLSTRAIHLEPVMDFSAHEFLHCVIRFVSRRGVPKTIISDNAAQFQLVKILGDQAWKKIPRDESVLAYASSNGMKWKFITELAPWQGGFYERLVGLVKSTLRTSIRRKLLTWTDLVTLLAESEAVVNSRPITYVSEDVDSRHRVIRPCDFLMPLQSALTESSSGNEVSPKNFGEAGKRLVSIWKQRCRTLETLWKCWYEDYLLSLRERNVISHKSNRSDKRSQPILGQVVLICDSDIPRGQWRLGKITKLFPGQDEQIRSAEVTLASGVILRRALNHLVPLEVESTQDHETGASPAQHQEVPTTDDRQQMTEDDRTTADDDGNAQTIDDPWFAQFNRHDDDSEFTGFDDDDIQRVLNALRREDDTEPGQDSTNTSQ